MAITAPKRRLAIYAMALVLGAGTLTASAQACDWGDGYGRRAGYGWAPAYGWTGGYGWRAVDYPYYGFRGYGWRDGNWGWRRAGWGWRGDGWRGGWGWRGVGWRGGFRR